VILALVIVGLVVCLLPVYALTYCCAKRSQEQALRLSRRLLHAELARQREHEQAQAAVIEEQRLDALDALPRKQWRNTAWDAAVSDEGGQQCEACCLCLEPFKDNDEVRVLPCSHYFHTACIDSWFAFRRFMPRSCPQCRRNPIATVSATAEEFGDGGRAGSAQQQQQQQQQQNTDIVVADHSGSPAVHHREQHRLQHIGVTYGRISPTVEPQSPESSMGDDARSTGSLPLPGSVDEHVAVRASC